jgi:hypothetical protein
MCLKLILVESRPQLFKIWSEIFSGFQNVLVLAATANIAFKSQKIDAELMRGIFAHERYGGKPTAGESQVLSTRGEVEMSPWIITTASIPGHIEKHQQKNGSFHVEIIPDKKITPEEECYILFSKAFEAIEKFNHNNQEKKINILGASLDFLNFPIGNPKKEASKALQAYSEHYSKGCKF